MYMVSTKRRQLKISKTIKRKILLKKKNSFSKKKNFGGSNRMNIIKNRIEQLKRMRSMYYLENNREYDEDELKHYKIPTEKKILQEIVSLQDESIRLNKRKRNVVDLDSDSDSDSASKNDSDSSDSSMSSSRSMSRKRYHVVSDSD